MASKMTDKDDGKASGTAAFSKFATVLALVGDAAEPPGMAQLAASSGYPRPTVYRIVGALVAQGWLVETLSGGAYQLGPGLLALASRSWERSDLRLLAISELQALRDATQETVHLAVPSAAEMVYIEKLESPHAVRMASRVGTRVTLYSSSVGKAWLAASAPAVSEPLIRALHFKRFTPHTLSGPHALREELALIRERGYAEDREENEAQIFCYGQAVLGADGRPAACISISIPLFRKQANPRRTYLEPLDRACQAIAMKLAQTPSLGV